jgi:cyclopropane-fatty-acyl-phospholipid synthase
MPKDTAVKLSALLENLLQHPLPIRLRAWDGSVADTNAASPGELIVRNRRALRRPPRPGGGPPRCAGSPVT